MAIFLMLGWWYGRGWLWVLKGIQNRLRTIAESFSVGILIKTWFAPWKQIRSAANFRNFLSAAIDNTVSRFVGAGVRTLMLATALLLTIFTLIGGIVAIILWPLVPASVIALIIGGLMGWKI